MSKEIHYYQEAGRDMAEAVKANESKSIREIFRWMVESLGLENDKSKSRIATVEFFKAFEAEMGD